MTTDVRSCALEALEPRRLLSTVASFVSGDINLVRAGEGTFRVDRAGDGTLRVIRVGTDGTWALTPQPTHLTSKGTLVIKGDKGNDKINVRRAGPGIVVELTFGRGGPFNATIATSTPASQVKRILVEGFGGSDTITIDKGVNERVTVVGGPGDDEIKGNYGATLIGGAGNDHLFAPARHAIDFADDPDGVLVDLEGAPDLASLLSGGEGDDRLFADHEDTIVGGRGHDTGGVSVVFINTPDEGGFKARNGGEFEGRASGIEQIGVVHLSVA